ncbi:P-loop NTPase [uncultured Bifidobacterium sp.]|uniref:Mrp/NBP35 family ATP-binding protein n=1 Tax=uncultured Bifidobacterium sp. TaxID=165187 RepID=UPI0037DDB14C
MTDARTTDDDQDGDDQGDMARIENDIRARLAKVIDPELGRSIVDLGMIAAIHAARRVSDGEPGEACDEIPDETSAAVAQRASTSASGESLSRPDDADASDDRLPDERSVVDVTVRVELTIAGCPLSRTITERITRALSSYPDALLVPHIEVTSMSHEKLERLVSSLKAERRRNPFSRPGVRTRIFAIASGKGGVGKSSVTANLAATFAALGYNTAAIDADVYGFSLPTLFGVHRQPTDVNGMLMPVVSWGVKLISIGMFAGSDRAILWRGPRLQRSLEQFLSDVWWGEPDVLLLDMAPGTGDMAISVAQTLPNAELVVITTPQEGASQVAVRSGLVALQVPMRVRGVVENMSWFEHRGERLEIFGRGGGERVSTQLTHDLHHDVPLLARLPFDPALRETDEQGRPVVLDERGSLAGTPLSDAFVGLAQRLMEPGDPERGE